MDSNCTNDTRDRESFGGKLFSAKIKPISPGEAEVTSGRAKSVGAGVKVALRAAIRENYPTFPSYGIMRDLP